MGCTEEEAEAAEEEAAGRLGAGWGVRQETVKQHQCWSGESGYPALSQTCSFPPTMKKPADK